MFRLGMRTFTACLLNRTPRRSAMRPAWRSACSLAVAGMLSSFGVLGNTWAGHIDGRRAVPRKGHVFSAKEHRQVEHIKESEEQRGVSPAEAKSIAYAAVNARKGHAR